MKSVGAALLAAMLLALAVAGPAQARKVDGTASADAAVPVNLQLTPTDAFVRIRGWSLPLPALPMSVFGSWGGKGTISGDGSVRIPSSGVAAPDPFQFVRDINGQDKTMTVRLSAAGDWTGTVDPLSGQAVMNLPMNVRVTASHIRLKKVIVWIYGNLDCTNRLDFNPMTTAHMEPSGQWQPTAPVTDGVPYDPATGAFTVINNSMSVGGFPRCDHPDIGGGTAADELSESLGLPAAPGKVDAKFQMSFLQGGQYVLPQPAIRPAFTASAAGPTAVALNASASYATAGASAYQWDFDGDREVDQSTTVARISHPYPSSGDKTIGLRVRDREGDVSGWASRSIVLKPGEPGPGPGPGGPGGPGGGTPSASKRCQNVQRGTPHRDRITGTRHGDRLIGRAGRDRLRGRGGRDCLLGGRGRDRINGGAGRDRINGGRGADRIRGGRGNDVIHTRGNARDRVDCGPGRGDRVIADRGDRLRRCEIVKRKGDSRSGKRKRSHHHHRRGAG